MAAFTSDEFSWNDITISINGKVMMACTGVSYKDSIESEQIYGKGGEAIGIQDGNRKIEGTIKCHQSELDKLIGTGDAGVKALKNLSIQWAFEKLGKVSTRVFNNCRITETGEDYKQGDKFAEVELPFICTSINYL